MKSARRYSDHRESVLIDTNARADDAGIRAEVPYPKTVAQDNVRSGVRPVFIAGMEHPAVCRLYAQHVEVVSGNSVVPALVSGIASGQARHLHAVGGHIREGCVFGLKINEIGIRLVIVAVSLMHYVVEACRLGHVQGLEDEGIQDTEHDYVRTDSQDKGDHRGYCECGGRAQLPRCVAQFAPEHIESKLRIGGCCSLSDYRSVAETNERVAASLFRRHAGGDVVGNAHFQMGLELTIDFLLDLRAVE